ncbi:MAG: alcohol dehydrogenase catalytic domain-containing protein, partial [Microthrixaceae bacterium]
MASKEVVAAVSRTVGENPRIELLTLADPGPDEVRVVLGASAVCHSDLSYIDGDWTPELPAVWGHEAAGIVESVGRPGNGSDSDSAVEPGDRVVVSLVRACGACRACRAGNAVCCTGEFATDHGSPLTDQSGAAVGRGLGTAAFAEAVVVHRSQVVAIPDELDMTAASLLGCGVLTGVGAVRRSSPVAPGQSVVVVGCGGVGLSAIQGAHISAAEHIVAVDPDTDRRSLALQLGAPVAIDQGDRAGPEHTSETLHKHGHLAEHVFV